MIAYVSPCCSSKVAACLGVFPRNDAGVTSHARTLFSGGREPRQRNTPQRYGPVYTTYAAIIYGMGLRMAISPGGKFWVSLARGLRRLAAAGKMGADSILCGAIRFAAGRRTTISRNRTSVTVSVVFHGIHFRCTATYRAGLHPAVQV